MITNDRMKIGKIKGFCKEVIDRLTFIKSRARAGATQETINKLAINFVNKYIKEAK